MRLARARTDDGVVAGEYTGGVVIDDEGTEHRIEESDLLAPCEPSALYCVGRNYAATIEQMDYERPEEPDFFIKPPASVLAPGEAIRYPTFSEEVTYAGELAAVIGAECHRVETSEVPDVVRGYTIMNDVDALDQQSRTARKAFDGSGPLGPWIETDLDPRGLDMETYVNGERRQDANTESMLFDPFEVVSYLSERFTFVPGDVIAFGSPANPGLIEPGDVTEETSAGRRTGDRSGDVIDIWYEGIGTLRNTVASVE